MVTQRIAALFALFALLGAACGFSWDDGTTDNKTFSVLVSYGDGETSISVIAPSDNEPVFNIDNPICTVGDVIVSEHSGRQSNYTVPITFVGEIGIADFTVTLGGHEILYGKIIAAGFVVKIDGVVVSGDDGDGVTLPQEGIASFDVMSLTARGHPADLWGAVVTARPMDDGVDMEELDPKNTMLFNERLDISIKKYRVGSGSFSLYFEVPSISFQGESFETILHCKQETTPEPPCVVDGPDLVSKAGVVEAEMYNILAPPLSSPVEEIVLSIGDVSFPYDSSLSSLVLPTSTVVFTGVTVFGDAKILCDGDEAVVVEDGLDTDKDLTVADGGGGEPLAVDTLIDDLPSSDTESLITSIIRVVNGHPLTLTKSAGEALLAEYTATVSASAAVITSITKGSAVVALGATVVDEEASSQALTSSFESCTFQTNTGYDCDELELGNVKVVNAVAAAAVSAGGLATWTIVLVSCIGALSLVALVVLSLWAVHRRSSQMSESDYSSSGPLGVPDPSDLLYEQSIIRDVYGRGEEGGPSVQSAIASEQQAAMREEYPLPPSSTGSGISRARATSEDASSTYSV